MRQNSNRLQTVNAVEVECKLSCTQLYAYFTQESKMLQMSAPDVSAVLHRPAPDASAALHRPASGVSAALHRPAPDASAALHRPASYVIAALHRPAPYVSADVKLVQTCSSRYRLLGRQLLQIKADGPSATPDKDSWTVKYSR